MMSFLLLTSLLLILVGFAADAYYVAKAKEAEDSTEAARLASMDAAMTDDRGRCWSCLDEARVLELVDTGRRYALLCASCATVTKALKAPTRQEAA